MSDCAFCAKSAGRGKHLCRKHWMLLDHWWMVQIGDAMKAERKSGFGPSGDDRVYQSEGFLVTLAQAVESLHVKTQKLAEEKKQKRQAELVKLRELWKGEPDAGT